MRACCGRVRHFYDGVPRRQRRESNTDHACRISCPYDCTKSSYNDLNFVQKHSDHPLYPHVFRHQSNHFMTPPHFAVNPPFHYTKHPSNPAACLRVSHDVLRLSRSVSRRVSPRVSRRVSRHAAPAAGLTQRESSARKSAHWPDARAHIALTAGEAG